MAPALDATFYICLIYYTLVCRFDDGAVGPATIVKAPRLWRSPLVFFVPQGIWEPKRSVLPMRKWFVSLVALFALLAASLGLASANIVDDWASVKPPPPPMLKPVTVDGATTALLVLDFVDRICSFPACTSGAVANVAKLIAGARAAHVPVIYSEVHGTTASNILPAVAPQSGEPIVVSHADKFIGTNLQQILEQKGVKTVIVTGVAANGAALYTASHAAILGFKVILPVDTIAAADPFAGQLTVWNVANAPGVGANATLTTSSLLKF